MMHKTRETPSLLSLTKVPPSSSASTKSFHFAKVTFHHPYRYATTRLKLTFSTQNHNTKHETTKKKKTILVFSVKKLRRKFYNKKIKQFCGNTAKESHKHAGEFSRWREKMAINVSFLGRFTLKGKKN